MEPRRKHASLPIYIVEDHCDALTHIYRNIGSGHLPFESNVLIHFDSHPDLLVDKNLDAETVFEKEKLIESLSIENWILPGCYSGQFSKVCWIKPPWAHQIEENQYTITIGRHNNKIRIGSDVYYFMSDGLCVDKKLLTNSRDFELDVVQMPSNGDMVKKCGSLPSAYILDVDLDFFSTKNPFLGMFEKGELYQRLQPIFTLDLESSKSYEDRISLASKHNDKLDMLERIFKHLATNFNLEEFEESIPDLLATQISTLVSTVTKFYDRFNFDWDILFNAGMTWDLTPLPHHVSTNQELSDGYKNFEEFLKRLPHPPTIVTIARSSDDDYCPKDQVDAIQEAVLQALAACFPKLNVVKSYLDQH